MILPRVEYPGEDEISHSRLPTSRRHTDYITAV
jgi:hypothetical protein